MGGSNPYIKPAEATPPKKAYKLTIIGENGAKVVIDVDPAKIPYNRTGLPGSILEIALGNGMEIDHACGGVCACATCHVKIKSGIKSINVPTDDEQDQLEEAPGLSHNSRLGCQSVPNGSEDVVVQVPAWGRNIIKEKVGG